MDEPNLLTICISAFISVFILLSFLALLMRLSHWVFPYKEEAADTALYAAVTSTINKLYPNSKITHFKEEK